MILYVCNETNIINNDIYEDVSAGFCIVEKYNYVYTKELPRFNQIQGEKPYGLPCNIQPQKIYAGIGNISHENQSQKHMFYIENCFKSENEVNKIKDTLFSKEICDVVWFRVYGSNAVPPDGYVSCGYDVTFPPEFDGAFSIVNDCMFICKWHGCDEDGLAFQKYYESLNDNGLFDNVELAVAFMKSYLSFGWSEKGEFCICEIFRKPTNYDS